MVFKFDFRQIFLHLQGEKHEEGCFLKTEILWNISFSTIWWSESPLDPSMIPGGSIKGPSNEVKVADGGKYRKANEGIVYT